MTLYDTLGIPPTASAGDIREAYRRHARKHHPDRGGDKATFQKVEQAGRILRDAAKRIEYDKTGSTGSADEPVTDEQHAVFVMKMLFVKCVDVCIKKGEGDPLELLRAEINKGLREAPDVLRAQRRNIADLEKARSKKLKGRASTPPHLEQALDAHIYQQKQILSQMELAERVGPLMLEMLQSYSWEDDAPPEYSSYDYTSAMKIFYTEFP